MMKDPRFPIGDFVYGGPMDAAERSARIEMLRALPGRVRELAERLSSKELEATYRPGGWTARQVLHHIADSQMHSFFRFKFALAEDEATIAPYPEDLWGELPDSRDAPVEMALEQLTACITRFAYLLSEMKPADFERKYRHPVAGPTTLDEELAMAAWHGEHHLAQAASVRAASRHS